MTLSCAQNPIIFHFFIGVLKLAKLINLTCLFIDELDRLF